MKVVNCDKRHWNVKLRTGAMVQEGGGFMRVRECCGLFKFDQNQNLSKKNFWTIILQLETIMMNGTITPNVWSTN